MPPHEYEEAAPHDPPLTDSPLSLFVNCAEAAILTDASSTILAVNPAFSAITGFSSPDVVGQSLAILTRGKYDRHFYARVWEQLRLHGQWSGDVYWVSKDGQTFHAWLSVNALTDPHQSLSQLLLLFSCVRRTSPAPTPEKELCDPLTGLLNRQHFSQWLGSWLKRSDHQPCAVLCLVDLAGFRQINDGHGFAFGDLVLQTCAQQLIALSRPEYPVARYGTDAFLMMWPMPHLPSSTDLATLRQLIQSHVEEGGAQLGLHGLGCAMAFVPMTGSTGQQVDEVLQELERSLQQIKQIAAFNAPDVRHAMSSDDLQEMVLRLQAALEAGALSVHYQPQFRLPGRGLTSCEALLRWHDELFGWVSPGCFIPLAESTELIHVLGEYALREACRQYVRWQGLGLELSHLSVNVSARQLEKADFVERVTRCLAETGMPGPALELELTESCLMQAPERALQQVAQLKALGVRLAIDDFGTGYSSLAYLKRFNPDVIKIDRAFIKGLPDDGPDVAIVRAVLDMSRSLGLSSLAEGVETQAQLALLSSMGCQYVQGFLTGRPMPAEVFEQTIRTACMEAG